MKFNHSRYYVLLTIILCYLAPLSLLVVYHKWDGNGWNTLSMGILGAMIGSLFLFWILSWWEAKLKKEIKMSSSNLDSVERKVESSNSDSNDDLHNQALDEALEKNNTLQSELNELNKKNVDLTYALEQEQLRAKQAQLEVESTLQNCNKPLEEQQTHIIQLQETIAEQKAIIEKKQQQIGLLETKVGDLTYEIKTLLKLAEAHSSSIYDMQETTPVQSASQARSSDTVHQQMEKQIHTAEEASTQLKRCLDIAQKITGSYRFNSQMNSLLDNSADSFTLDLRRLCDSLRSEHNSAILLYSPKETQILFVNNQIKALTGWSPEKFIQNFNDIVIDCSSWNKGIAALAMCSETQFKMPIKSKSGGDLAVQARVGMIPTGIFRQHAIAVLFSDSSTELLHK